MELTKREAKGEKGIKEVFSSLLFQYPQPFAYVPGVSAFCRWSPHPHQISATRRTIWGQFIQSAKRCFGQISSSMETKLVLIHILFIPRREKTYRILTASAERERISKRKKQLEQEIELIERKIYLEEMMHIARKRNSRPPVRRVIARYESF